MYCRRNSNLPDQFERWSIPNYITIKEIMILFTEFRLNYLSGLARQTFTGVIAICIEEDGRTMELGNEIN